MVGVAIEGNAILPKELERSFLPVIGVNVRQDDGVDFLPGAADHPEPGSHALRTEAQVDEDAKSSHAQQTGVPRAAAGQNREIHYRQSMNPLTLMAVYGPG